MSEPPLTMSDFVIAPLTPEEELTVRLQKRKVGRPGYKWSDEIVEEICEQLALGEAIGDICSQPGMPSYWLVNKRERTDPEFANLLQLARDAGTEYHLSQVVKIADDNSNDTLEVTYGRGDNAVTKEVCNTEWVNRSKLRVDTRFTKAKMQNPRKYNVAAAHVEHEHEHRHSGIVEIRKIEIEYIAPDPTLAQIVSVEDIADETEG